jgi:hypothetical protein
VVNNPGDRIGIVARDISMNSIGSRIACRGEKLLTVFDISNGEMVDQFYQDFNAETEEVEEAARAERYPVSYSH